MVIDKTRNLAALLMICHLNSQQVRDEITYKFFYGDKESYWFAHALTSSPYHFVPGYSGGLGRISHPLENARPNTHREHICTLQLLHVLESTQDPLWFNNAIVENKKAGNMEYIVAEGWVGHDGRWKGAVEARFRNEFCVEMPEGERDQVVGLPDPVNRVEGELKKRLEKIVHLAEKYDEFMEEEELISIVR